MASATQHPSVAVIDEGQGPSVVFLHGAPDHREEWREVIQLLRPHYRCLAPDLPGFGETATPPHYDFSIDAQAAFLDTWLHDVFGHEKITLVTHDIGAMMGLAWAAAHSERVRGILVMNTVFHRDYHWHVLARIWSTPILGELFMLILNRAFFISSFKRDEPRLSDEQILRMYGGITKMAKQSLLRLYRKMTRPDFFQAWEARVNQAAKQMPICVLWGVLDPYVPQAYAHRFGGVVKLIADCGHWVPLEKPERVAEEVRALASR